MRFAWVMAALLAAPGSPAGQPTGVLQITVTLGDASQSVTPVGRHYLLISDNPATREPRRVFTAANGTVSITLPPGSYTVESDRPTVFHGKAYTWTQMVDVVAGREVLLQLTADNADVTAAATPEGAATPDTDPSFLIAKWEPSLVAIWSPTGRASGVLVDARGLIATTSAAINGVSAVHVQLSPTLKVPARVLVADRSSGAAVAWIDPRVVADRVPVALPCPPARFDENSRLSALGLPFGQPMREERGSVTTVEPRVVATDLRVPFGGAGGPVFDENGTAIGLSAIREATDPRRLPDVVVVRMGLVCDAVSAAQGKLAGATPLEPVHLPVEAVAPARVARGEADRTLKAAPHVMSSSEFEIAFITPPALDRAQDGWTGGGGGRSIEAEARIGELTDFGSLSEYFEARAPSVIVRVTPRLVEGFWKRVAREAARTQGAALPPLKNFKSDFVRMQAFCGSDEVTPIQPFVLEHKLSDTDVLREGLYVFGPDAFGPRCGTVTLSLYSEKAPERADTVTVTPAIVGEIGRELAPYVAPAQQGGVAAFTGLTLIDGTGRAPVSDAVILVRDGRILAAGPSSSVIIPAGASRVALDGAHVIPGLINAHGHVNNVDRDLDTYAKYGVTTVFSLGNDDNTPAALAARDAQATPSLRRARIFTTGPVLAPTTPEQARADVARVAAMKVDLVKIRVDDNLGTTPKMPPPVYRAVIDEAHKRGLRVAAHLFYREDAKGLLDAGADFIAHSIRDLDVDAETIAKAKARGACLCPTLMREVSTFVYESSPPFFSDPLFTKYSDPQEIARVSAPAAQAAVAKDPAARAYKIGLDVARRNMLTMAKAGIPVAMGTDTGPPGRFQGYFELMELELMAQAGMTPAEVLRAATIDAARCHKVDADLGTIQPGRWADFVALDANPLADIANVKKIRAVYIAGNAVPR